MYIFLLTSICLLLETGLKNCMELYIGKTDLFVPSLGGYKRGCNSVQLWAFDFD